MTTPDKQTFRGTAMACVGAAVNIITTDGGGDDGIHCQRGVQRHGFASHPAGMPEPRRVRLATFGESRTLCVNTLSAGQAAIQPVWRQNANGDALCRRAGKRATRGVRVWCAGLV